jgi:hypothetical protein
LRTQAVGMKSCRPRSGLLTWHPSASTADSLLRSFCHHYTYLIILTGDNFVPIVF